MNARTPIALRAQMLLGAFALWLNSTLSTLRERMDRSQPALVRGQALVEYGLILALIAVVVIVVVKLIGSNAKNSLNNVANNL